MLLEEGWKLVLWWQDAEDVRRLRDLKTVNSSWKHVIEDAHWWSEMFGLGWTHDILCDHWSGWQAWKWFASPSPTSRISMLIPSLHCHPVDPLDVRSEFIFSGCWFQVRREGVQRFSYNFRDHGFMGFLRLRLKPRSHVYRLSLWLLFLLSGRPGFSCQWFYPQHLKFECHEKIPKSSSARPHDQVLVIRVSLLSSEWTTKPGLSVLTLKIVRPYPQCTLRDDGCLVRLLRTDRNSREWVEWYLQDGLSFPCDLSTGLRNPLFCLLGCFNNFVSKEEEDQPNPKDQNKIPSFLPDWFSVQCVSSVLNPRMRTKSSSQTIHTCGCLVIKILPRLFSSLGTEDTHLNLVVKRRIWLNKDKTPAPWSQWLSFKVKSTDHRLVTSHSQSCSLGSNIDSEQQVAIFPFWLDTTEVCVLVFEKTQFLGQVNLSLNTIVVHQ